MTRPGPITDDFAPSDQFPWPAWDRRLTADDFAALQGDPGAMFRRTTIGPIPIGPKPIVVVDRGPVVTDAERDAVRGGRGGRAAWLEASGGN